MSWFGVAVAAAVCAALVGLASGPVLRRLPEPQEPAAGKTPYAMLAGRGFAIGCAAASAVLMVLVGVLLPAPVRPPWFVLGTVGVLLAGIDARTTWLPLRLTQVGWLLMTAAAGAGVLIAGLGGGPWLRQLLGTVLGALAAGGLYLVVWLLSRGGFGFGDVRFAPLIGAATGAHSAGLLGWSLVLGSLSGALYGVGRLLGRRRTPFPYAPAMLAGAALAVALQPILG